MSLETATSAPGRVPQLDGLRGLAILGVLVWHYVAVPLVPVASGIGLSLPLRFTWSGVDLFFVLSGYLIGGILLDHRTAARYFQAFYTRRALRILPLYLLCLASFYVARAVVGEQAMARFPELFADSFPAWSYLTFSQNFLMALAGSFGPEWTGITWSLAVEEQFYLLLPLLIRWAPPHRLPWVLGALALAAPFVRLALDPSGRQTATVLLICRADALALGVLCAWLMRRPAQRYWLATHRRLLYALLMLQVAVLFGVAAIPQVAEASPNASYYSRMALLYATLLLLAVTEVRGPVHWLTTLGWLRHLGVLAYGLYLIHSAALGLLHGAFLGREPILDSAAAAALTVAAALLTYGLAVASWRLLEAPLIARGHRSAYGERLPPERPQGSSPDARAA